MTVSPPQQDFIPSPEQFLDLSSPVEVYATPYDSATADFGTSLSGHSADSNIMHTVPQTVAGTDSIPFTASGPFQDLYSQAPNFIPQPHSSIDSQNPQVLSTNFNVSSNSSTYFPQTSDGTPRVDVTPVQVFDNLNPSLNNASLMQQIVDDIVMMDEPNFNPTASVSADYSTNNIMGANITHSQGAGEGSLVLNTSSLTNAGQHCPSSNSPVDAVDYDGGSSIINPQSNVHVSNLDIQDILQQFM
ncbi:MAG: hypothetical protein MJE68_11530 [Proteobacteria bacterium]|nr:hypothetical protein [Pseudomonadota bacterium]